jgi:hypothetical protein
VSTPLVNRNGRDAGRRLDIMSVSSRVSFLRGDVLMIVSVFVRRLREGCTFEDFVNEWEADQGFGVPTRVFNAQSLDDPRDVIPSALWLSPSRS